MPVLKSERSRFHARDAIVLDLGDLDREARRIIDQARADAAAIVASAKQEAEKLTSEAAGVGHALGLEQGLQEGRAQGNEEGRREVVEELRPRFEDMLESWSSALDAWAKDRTDMLLAARQDVLAFAIEMGRKITTRIVEANPGVVIDQVAEALAHLMKPTAVTLSVHPEDRELLAEALPALLAKFAQCTDAAIQEEPSMQRGGCVLRTGKGEIDAAIEAQIDRVIEALFPASNGHEAKDV